MKILYLFLFCVIGSGLYLIFQKKFRSSILYTLAIGSACNANVFNSANFPIKIGNFVFGMESVVYMLFLFCVLMMFAYYGKKDVITLIVCSMGAIIFAAIIEFIAGIAANGFSLEILLDFLTYLSSCIASILACLAMLSLFHFLRKKKVNLFLAVILVLIVASLVESVVFNACTSSFKISILTREFWMRTAALYMGKAIALVFALITLVIVNFAFKGDKVPYIAEVPTPVLDPIVDTSEKVEE